MCARKTKAKKAEKVEAPNLEILAGLNDGRDITRGYAEALTSLQPQDKILKDRGRGDLSAYEALLDDDQVMPTFQQRRMAIIAREWRVEPASDEAVDVEAADFLREQLSDLLWDETNRRMLAAAHYGFAVAECIFKVCDDYVVLDDLRVRRQRRFKFAPSGELLLCTTKNPKGEVMPDRKFWVVTMGADDSDDPYGLGLAHYLFWPVFFKRNALRFWMAFLDKFGTPTTVIEAPAGTSEDDEKKLLAIARSIHRDTGVVVPQGVLIRYLESARSAGGDFGVFCDRMDAAISKIILGQTMTTDDGSSLSQSKTHLSVRDQILKADADLLCESFNRSVATWLTEWNFPGARPPKVWRVFEVAEDLIARSQRDATIAQIGYRPTIEEIKATYGGEWEPMPSAPAVPLEGAAFAEPEPTAPLDPGAKAEADIADRLDATTDELIDRLSGEVQEIVRSSKSLEEVRERLYALMPGQTLADAARTVGQALTVAQLMGLAEVSAEVLGNR
ncbi:MAG: DUF935 domain-containing protein [Myxococcales bacterium]|nr:DUF935 domain-containing protein [Myxococcales bacterium]